VEMAKAHISIGHGKRLDGATNTYPDTPYATAAVVHYLAHQVTRDEGTLSLLLADPDLAKKREAAEAQIKP
jgi:hypothetical protein